MPTKNNFPIDPKVSKALTALGEACGQVAAALVCFARAAMDCLIAIASDPDVAQLLKVAEAHAAIEEASPRVRHLARHGKKHRTRKKNLNRALREYQRRH